MDYSIKFKNIINEKIGHFFEAQDRLIVSSELELDINSISYNKHYDDLFIVIDVTTVKNKFRSSRVIYDAIFNGIGDIRINYNVHYDLDLISHVSDGDDLILKFIIKDFYSRSVLEE